MMVGDSCRSGASRNCGRRSTCPCSPFHKRPVIALAAGAAFTGRALDPPLRSRLQAHVVPSFDVDELPPHEDLAAACAALVEIERANAVAAAASRSSDTTFAFSGTAIKRVARHAPDARAVLERCYPPLAGRYLLGKAVSKDAVEAVDRVLGAPAADEGAGRADGASGSPRRRAARSRPHNQT